MGKWLTICCGVMMSSAVLAAISTPDESKKYLQFELNVPDVSPEKLYPEYWISQLDDPDLLLMTEKEIKEYNRLQFETVPMLVDLNHYPLSLSREKLLQAMSNACSLANDLATADGKPLTPERKQSLQNSLAQDTIPQETAVEFGLIVNRADMRTFPTMEMMHDSYLDEEVDVFQETCLFIGEPVAVLHRSLDKNWLLVQNYNYLGWVPATDVAIGDRQQVLDYANNPNRLVVTGGKIQTAMAPKTPGVSLRTLEMGSSYPLVEQPDAAVNGMSPYSSFVVSLPLRQPDGTLAFASALIARQSDVNIGHLPYTRRFLTKQLFKFLGERYGWGHGNQARDCSGYLNDVLKTFGVVQPRNGGQQERYSVGQTFQLGEKSLEERVELLKSMQLGDALFSPGHVMIYLGKDAQGNPFMIHDTLGISFLKDGKKINVELRAVSLTPILPLLAGQKSYLEQIRTGRRYTLPSAE